MADQRLLVFPDQCTGCRACEVACVAYHEGVFGRTGARIRVIKQEDIGLDYPTVCRLCTRPPCVGACPVQALHKDTDTGAVIVTEAKCIGCGACADACPFGAAELHPHTGLALICDLCGGDPACVKRCATGAIAYGDRRTQAQERQEARALQAYTPILARWGLENTDAGQTQKPEGP